MPDRTAARRNRKLRRRRKAGLVCFDLPLPVKQLEEVVRARENLPVNAPVSRRQIYQALVDGIGWWSKPWIALRAVTRNARK
jgi:hypothetical protein